MHAWAQGVEWFWMAFFMVALILLIASFGYAAVLVALRPPHAKIDTGRPSGREESLT